MSKQIKARSMNRKTAIRTDGHGVLLAGIGAASLLRKNANKVIADASAAVDQLPEKSAEFIEAVVERASAFKVEFVNRLLPSFGRRVKAMASDGVARAGSRLQPLLDQLGIKSKPVKRGAAAARKSSAKRTSDRPRKAA